MQTRRRDHERALVLRDRHQAVAAEYRGADRELSSQRPARVTNQHAQRRRRGRHQRSALLPRARMKLKMTGLVLAMRRALAQPRTAARARSLLKKGTDYSVPRRRCLILGLLLGVDRAVCPLFQQAPRNKTDRNTKGVEAPAAPGSGRSAAIQDGQRQVAVRDHCCHPPGQQRLSA